jgi:diguanylate cyclase (GGDEF)-like protein/PAS domain S-box-containing protein
MAELDTSAHYDGPFRHVERSNGDTGEDSFRRLVDRSPDGIVVHRDGRIVYVNATAVRWVGAQYADQVRGQLFSEFLHPDSLPQVLERLTSLRQDGDVTRPSEGLVVRLDGTTLTVEAVTTLTTWGGVPAYHVTMRDLTHLRTAERALREQAALVDRVGVAIIGTTTTGLVTKWNKVAETMYRRPAANALALPIGVVVGADLDPVAVVEQGGVTIATHHTADGQPLMVRVSATALDSGYALVCTDETKAHGSERLLRMIVESLDEGILVIDGAGGVVSANPAAEKIIGLSEQDLADGEGRTIHALPMYDVDRRRIPLADHPVAHTLRTGKPFQGYVLGIDRADGRRIWLRTSGRRLDTDHRYAPATMVSFSDITAERVARERLTYRATHDALTGLPNRLVIVNQISDSLRERGELRLGAVLFIDLDNLKAINDSLGHDSGDELLQSVGHCLRTSVGPNDVVGRLGGDEFVTLVKGDVGPVDLDEFVSRLEHSLSEPMTLGAATVRTQASIGVTVVAPDDPRSPVEILRDADAAMYETKAKRRQLTHRIAVAMPDPVLHDPLPGQEEWPRFGETSSDDRDDVSADGGVLRYPRRF